MVAGLTSRAEEALRAARALPDGSRPAAFHAELRNQSSPVAASGPAANGTEPPRSGGAPAA
jgi:hypothetical protein